MSNTEKKNIDLLGMINEKLPSIPIVLRIMVECETDMALAKQTILEYINLAATIPANELALMLMFNLGDEELSSAVDKALKHEERLTGHSIEIVLSLFRRFGLLRLSPFFENDGEYKGSIHLNRLYNRLSDDEKGSMFVVSQFIQFLSNNEKMWKDRKVNGIINAMLDDIFIARRVSNKTDYRVFFSEKFYSYVDNI